MYPLFSGNPVGQSSGDQGRLVSYWVYTVFRRGLNDFTPQRYGRFPFFRLSSLRILMFDQKQEVQSELPGMIQDYR